MNQIHLQTQFFSQLSDPRAIIGIFEHLPEIYFFIKDRKGQIIAASNTILNRLGMTTESDFIGKTDAEVYPPHLADAYRADDDLVFSTGKPLLDRLEVWLDESGRADWCVTTKVPLKDSSGQTVGLMGVSRRDLDRAALEPNRISTRAVAYLHKHIERISSIEELARGIRVSLRTLNRKINHDLGISPYELILRIRIQLAAEALMKTSEPISSIALSHGFCDQSHFTQHFRKRMGMTPKRFRSRQNSK